jgi:hypothetical protein
MAMIDSQILLHFRYFRSRGEDSKLRTWSLLPRTFRGQHAVQPVVRAYIECHHARPQTLNKLELRGFETAIQQPFV